MEADASVAAPGRSSEAEADGLAEFVAVRRRLYGIAYRTLGRAAEAEDVVQDVWLRWQRTDRRVVQNAPAYLATTTARLAINLAHSARVRRETCVQTWLPEPVDDRPDPQSGAERGEAMECAIVLLLEMLSPAERAAYVLREAFGHPYRRIADALRLGEANTRQIVTRARKRIADGLGVPVCPAERRRRLDAFVAAARTGALAAMDALLAAAVASDLDVPTTLVKPRLPRGEARRRSTR